MIAIRKNEQRGKSDFGWLDSRHTFSFGDYADPAHRGFRSLRVINEDRVAAGKGFGAHPHHDMEILSYVIDGSIAHQDSMGNGSVVVPGELQRMTAGTGVAHSEFNPSETDPLHFLQIWIRPEQSGLTPGYEQKAFPLEENHGQLTLVASRDGRDGSLTVHQDVSLYSGRFDQGQLAVHELQSGRHGWVQVVRGELAVNGERLQSGDGAAISGEDRLALEARSESEVLVFDLN